MKRNITIAAVGLMMIIVLTSAIILTGEIAKASNVYYYLPYFQTNASGVTYCVASNMSSESLTVSFTVGSNPNGNPTGTANTFATTLASKTTRQYAFSGQTVTGGSDTISISSDAGTSDAYAGTLTFSTTATTTGTRATCKSLIMACFQGTTSPRRNLIGYICEDDSTSGPGGNKIMLGF
ncbi:MAG: hypothetical protein HQK92_08625 [Nitrospirae bacterium]|nr:hypothetical protein [Nitrospirota bacterium]